MCVTYYDNYVHHVYFVSRAQSLKLHVFFMFLHIKRVTLPRKGVYDVQRVLYNGLLMVQDPHIFLLGGRPLPGKGVLHMGVYACTERKFTTIF